MDHIDGLAKELKCSICLGVMSAPVGRTPCCHYFCLDCIHESIRHKPACPVCKAKVGRRDVARDETMDRVVCAFASVEKAKQEILAAASQPPPGSAGAGEQQAALGSPAAGFGGICWLQGDPDYKSPSRSLSASALAELRRQRRLSLPSAHNTPCRAAAAQQQQQQKQQAAGDVAEAAAGVDKDNNRAECALGQRGQGSFEGAPQVAARGAEQQQQEAAAALAEPPASDYKSAVEEQQTAAMTAEPSAGSSGASPQGLLGGAPGSAGVDLILQGLSQEEASEGQLEARRTSGPAAATAAAAVRSPAAGGDGGEQLTPLPQQVAAPQTDKAQHASGGTAGSAGQKKGGEQRGTSSTAPQQKRKSGATEAGVPASAAAAGDAAGGGSKKRANKSSAPVADRRRRSTSAGPGEASGPGSGAGPGEASAPGSGAGRRIPTRLLPWHCAACTYQNAGAASKCEVCGTAKRVLPAAALAALCGGAGGGSEGEGEGKGAAGAAGPAPAAAEQRLAADMASPAGGEVAPPPQQPRQRHRQQQAAAAGKQQRQRKMSAGGSGAKRQRMAKAPAAAAAAATPAAAGAEPAATPVVTSGRRSTSPGTSAGPAVGEAAAAAGDAGPGAEVAPAWRASRHHPCSSWVLLGSGLEPEGKAALARLAAAAGAAVASKWRPGVTHVVCGAADGAARRTYKYLMGILSGAWVVDAAWAAACLDRCTPVEEGAFEVARDSSGSEGGPAAARASAALGLPKLLDGYELYLAGDFANRADVAALLKAAGGRELKRPPPGPAAPGGPCTSFIMVEGSLAGSPTAGGGGAAAAAGAGRGHTPGAGAGDERRWRDKAAAAGVPLVSHRWLLDSVSSYTAKPLAPYRLDGGDGEEGAP